MMNKVKILVIDDELSVRKLLRYVLEAEGYQVLEAGTGELGLMYNASHRPDIILLDLGLPDLEGQVVLQRIREWTNSPVLILMANKEDDEKVKLLDMGADDYLIKPFNMQELLARIRVALRHANRLENEIEPVIQIGDLKVDVGAHLVYVRDEEIKLTGTEFSFLALLSKNIGRVVTQNQLLNEIWGPGNTENTHYLRVYAAQLRKKVEVPLGKKLIYTEPGVGYRMLSEPAEKS